MEEPTAGQEELDDENAEEMATIQQINGIRPVNDLTSGPNQLIGAEIFLPHGDRNEIARVMERKRNSNGLFIGRAHRNPILDSRVFTVEFPDGDQMDIGYNVIAANTYSRKLLKKVINTAYSKKSLDIGRMPKPLTRPTNIERVAMDNQPRNKQSLDGTWKWNGLMD